ncbi:MAG TPA: polysaccharide deacetylase family protein [Vicinamibacterales bacterium]|nr:polysaccharide deacetylase family protein [Vicinamibacterales bacterium]
MLKATLARSPFWELSAAVRAAGCAVLTYHRVGTNPHGFKHVPEDTFRRQMLWLSRHCRPVAPHDFREACVDGNRRRPPVLITFDDGYRDYRRVAYPILRELRIPAINFVATQFVEDGEARFWWDQVDLAVWASTRPAIELFWRDGERVTLDHAGRERVRMDVRRYVWSRPDSEKPATLARLLDALDVRPAAIAIERQVMTWEEIRDVGELTTIGGHTHTHPLMSRVDGDRLREEVAACRERIARHIGAPATFAYPAGATSDAAKRAVRDGGFDLAFCTAPGLNDRRTDWLAVRRFNAPRDVDRLAYLLSGLAYH